MERRQILSMLVHNHPGVLLRITGLFNRKGFNIDSLTVSVTHDPRFSRMTIVIRGNDALAEQVRRLVSKVADVKEARILPDETAVFGELMLIKVSAGPEDRAAVHKIAVTYGADVVNIGQRSMTLQVTGAPEELDELVTHLGKQGILELVRTGLTALEKGDGCLVDHIAAD